MKYFWIAVDVEENGKGYAFAFKVSENDNLKFRLADIQNLYTANIMPSKKAALKIVSVWNDAHKACGNYMFAES